MKKFIRSFSIVGLSVLFVISTLIGNAYQSNFFNSKYAAVKYNINSPVVVHADETTTETVRGWGVIATVLGMMGTTFATKKVGQTVSYLWKQYCDTTQKESDYLTNELVPKVVGDSVTLGNKALDGISAFNDWLLSLSKNTSGPVHVSIPAGTVLGTYSMLNSVHTKDNTFGLSNSVRTAFCTRNGSDANPWGVVVFLSDTTFSMSYTSNGSIITKDANYGYGNDLTDKFELSSGGLAYGDVYTAMPIINVGENGNWAAVLRTAFYGDTAVASHDGLNDVVVNENGENKFKDISLGTDNLLLLDGMKALLDKYNQQALSIGSDNTLSLDDINQALDKHFAAASDTTLDPAIPATYPIADSIPDVKPVPTTYNPTDTTTAKSYGVLGLQDVFPFCVPFDMYAIVTAFVATPETPSFDWATPWGTTVHIDFHSFDDLAFWLRKALAVIFLIGLLAATRNSLSGD